MSEEIQQAAADRAAELAAIRSRAERLLYEYGEDIERDGDETNYLASAWLWDGATRVLDLAEPDVVYSPPILGQEPTGEHNDA